MAKERLQKFLARAGVASRRAAERLIVDGHVRVDGKIVRTLGTQVDSHKQKVEVDGRRVHSEKHVYYVVHKPREMVTTLEDPEGRDTIKQLLKHIPERVYPVGRLDYHTSGALLVTNDGELTEALLRPGSHAPKVYAAKLQGHLDEDDLGLLRNGIELDDGYTTKRADVFVLREEQRSSWIQLTLTEGKNRQIHRMAEALGRRVLRLVRLSFAGIDTEGLRPKQVRPLLGREIEKLKKNYVTPRRRQKVKTKAEDAELIAMGRDPAEERRKQTRRRAAKAAAKASGPNDSVPAARRPAKKRPTGKGPAKKGPPRKGAGKAAAETRAARKGPAGPRKGGSGARHRSNEARAAEVTGGGDERRSRGDSRKRSGGARKAAGSASGAPKKGAPKRRGKPARPGKKGPARGRSKKSSK